MKITVPRPTDFDRIVKENLPSKHLFVLVCGSIDASTNQSWCPDCVRADPFIHSALSKLDGHVLLECPVERSEYKGNPDYPYRTHPQLRIKAVPTLIRWTDAGPRERLVEGECTNPDLLDELVRVSQE